MAMARRRHACGGNHGQGEVGIGVSRSCAITWRPASRLCRELSGVLDETAGSGVDSAIADR